MKNALVLFLIAASLVAPLAAQDEATPTPKPARKRLFFLPGAKIPEPTPAPATPAPTPKVTPKPSPKPKASPKPAAKAEPSPAPKTENQTAENPAPVATPKPESTPAAKPATPAAAAKKESKPAEIVVARTSAVERPSPDKLASPAVITSTVPPAPAQIVRAFFALLGKGDIDGAYAGLMKGSRIGERPDEVRSLKSKTKEAIDVF
ncbi:MAG TPA: hypothetical protein VEO95_08410, partial [Chthoniobacteraceae bacterium]|nr:hypothetical protein [Chthoniobacteraceae bacterium]